MIVFGLEVRDSYIGIEKNIRLVLQDEYGMCALHLLPHRKLGKARRIGTQGHGCVAVVLCRVHRACEYGVVLCVQLGPHCHKWVQLPVSLGHRDRRVQWHVDYGVLLQQRVLAARLHLDQTVIPDVSSVRRVPSAVSVDVHGFCLSVQRARQDL